jgi:DNA-binding NarL/FixJ family response regulator
METIRVLVADDHAVLRLGLGALLANQPDLCLVGEATTGDEAQRLCEELQPDVLLLDLSMPGRPARETVGFVRERSPVTRVVILSAYCDGAAVRELVALGVDGYVVKDDAPDAAVRAIRSVSRGDTWFSRPVMAELAGREAAEGRRENGPELTERERQLLGMLADGWDNARIAAELKLRPQTVRNYLTRLFAKLGVGTRAEAAAWLRRRGDSDRLASR